MPSQSAVHVDQSGEFLLPIPVDQAFVLFTPEGERSWVEGWDPEYLHPPHPSSEVGTVFRTRHHGEETLWLVLEFDPHAHSAVYGRFTPGSRVGTVAVQCSHLKPRETRITVRYSLTAISPAGAETLTALTQTAYSEMLEAWRSAILRARSSARG